MQNPTKEGRGRRDRLTDGLPGARSQVPGARCQVPGAMQGPSLALSIRATAGESTAISLVIQTRELGPREAVHLSKNI